MIAVLASRFDDESKDALEKWNLNETVTLLTPGHGGAGARARLHAERAQI